MKENVESNKAVARIILIIMVVILVVLVSILLVLVLKNSSKTIKQADENTDLVGKLENQDDINAQIPTEVQKPAKELVFTKAFLQTGQSSGDVQIIENRLDESIVISITGTASNDINQTSLVEGKNRWYKNINLTDYKTLEFYARKEQDNGDMMVGIDTFIIKRIRFPEFPTTWTKYEIDVSEYTGEHVITFAGGYADNTGSQDSCTQYRNIKLK